MPTLKIRDLAGLGILTDPNPYDLPTNAFSGGSNVRFEVGKARRAPIFRVINGGYSTYEPQFCAGYRPTSGFDLVFTGNTDGTITQLDDGIGTDVTPLGRVKAGSDEAWTSAFLGDVMYLNHPTLPPAALLPSASRFVSLTGWNADHRAKVLRSFKDQLIALNISKANTSHPTMIKYSDVTLAGQMPGSWDPSNLSALTNEVEIAQLNGGWLDGCPMGDAMILYSTDQVWSMTWTGNTADAAQNLYVFKQTFSDGGIINTNCVVAVEGRHYVFGPSDIYMHDGNTRKSISDGRVREWVYRNLNQQMSDRCFAFFMPQYNEILFAFVSGDANAFFTSPTRCNRGAVYNVGSDTWSLVDLPNISAGTLATQDPTLAWQNAPVSWENIGGSWYDLQDGYVEHVVFTASAGAVNGPKSHRLLAYDHMDRGQLAYGYDVESNAPAYLERLGIDLDAEGADITTYKAARRILPQVNTYRAVPLVFEVGSSLTSAGSYSWTPKMSFDPARQYKLDFDKGGRYLALRISVPEAADFEVSGYDIEIKSRGRY